MRARTFRKVQITSMAVGLAVLASFSTACSSGSDSPSAATGGFTPAETSTTSAPKINAPADLVNVVSTDGSKSIQIQITSVVDNPRMASDTNVGEGFQTAAVFTFKVTNVGTQPVEDGGWDEEWTLTYGPTNTAAESGALPYANGDNPDDLTIGKGLDTLLPGQTANVRTAFKTQKANLTSATLTFKDMSYNTAYWNGNFATL